MPIKFWEHDPQWVMELDFIVLEYPETMRLPYLPKEQKTSLLDLPLWRIALKHM